MRRDVTNSTEPLKVYPLKPPGIFNDELSSASTAPSEMGEDGEQIAEMASPISASSGKGGHETRREVEKMEETMHQSLKEVETVGKEFFHDMQVLALDRASGCP